MKNLEEPDITEVGSWQWHEVERHSTKLIRLITEGIAKVNLKTKQTTYYLLRDKSLVKRTLDEEG